MPGLELMSWARALRGVAAPRSRLASEEGLEEV